MKIVKIINLNSGNVDVALMTDEDSQMLINKFEFIENINFNIFDASVDNVESFEEVSDWNVFTDTEQWTYDESW